MFILKIRIVSMTSCLAKTLLQLRQVIIKDQPFMQKYHNKTIFESKVSMGKGLTHPRNG